MAWLRLDDGYNRKPEIHALHDGSYRALQCSIEAAEAYDACGLAIDSYAVSFYPHARQKLRSELRKLADRGLVHFLQSPDDRDHDCPTCQIRWEELRGEGGEELREKLGTSSTTSTQSSKTEPMWFCVRDFYATALTPTQKRNTKQGAAKRQRVKRKKDKAAESRRDAQPPSHPSVPAPVPLEIYNYVTPPPNDPAPSSAADPSEPSSGTADRDAVSWLREKLHEGRKRVGCLQPKWKDENQGQLEAVVRKARKAPGDTGKILNGALDGFFADPAQLKYRYSPAGLAHGFDTYAAEVLEQEAEAFSARKRVERDKKRAAGDAAILARDAEKKAKLRAEREANETPGEREAEAVAELVPAIGAKLGRA
jgi:hypothetical protein